jgi:lipoprotein-anchoring transpeptidase ErfK/SrfK
LLSPAPFECGEIDGRFHFNTCKALWVFQATRGIKPAGVADSQTWKLLNQDQAPVLVSYRIVEEDLAGPFVKIPRDMMEQAKVEKLGYQSPLEALGERCHSSPKLLTPPPTQASSVVVDASSRSVYALDEPGNMIIFYPATVGSKHDPLPVGEWTINSVHFDPPFNYNPDLFWDARADHSKATIPPRPNNPVGSVWIDLSKEHYGSTSDSVNRAGPGAWGP